MARRRFFVHEVRRETAELTGPDAEHLVRVLRAEAGQIYEVSDNQNAYLAQVEVARKSVVSFRILQKLPEPAPAVHLTLCAALIKFDSFEWTIEKATELGVAVIRPFEAARTENGLAQASVKRRTRWERIALEASQQSRRLHLPLIEETGRLAKTLETDADIRLILDEDPSSPPILRQLPTDRYCEQRIALLLGPEGGWTEEERALALRSGWLPCSLGASILRAETAGVAGLAVVQAAWAAGTTAA